MPFSVMIQIKCNRCDNAQMVAHDNATHYDLIKLWNFATKELANGRGRVTFGENGQAEVLCRECANYADRVASMMTPVEDDREAFRINLYDFVMRGDRGSIDTMMDFLNAIAAKGFFDVENKPDCTTNPLGEVATLRFPKKEADCDADQSES